MPVWKEAPIVEVPVLRLVRSSFREVEPGTTRHLVGYNVTERKGRVSSSIEAYDPAMHRPATDSGRVYELIGRPGYDADAEYVWQRWLGIMGDVTWRDVTDEYASMPPAED